MSSRYTNLKGIMRFPPVHTCLSFSVVVISRCYQPFCRYENTGTETAFAFPEFITVVLKESEMSGIPCADCKWYIWVTLVSPESQFIISWMPKNSIVLFEDLPLQCVRMQGCTVMTSYCVRDHLRSVMTSFHNSAVQGQD